MSLLRAQSLAIGYAGRAIADGIDLTLEPGRITYLLGPNGVGKTTLFRSLIGLLAPIAGVIWLGETALAGMTRAAIAKRVAYVPQGYAGAFAYRVIDLVTMGRTAFLGAFGTPGPADLAISMDALAALGIADLAQRDASLLSGGERQLALIARALAQQARVIVMDEPTAALDLGNRLLVLDRIAGLAADGRAVLVSTHEPEHAFAVADQVAVLGRDRRFEVGAPAAILTSDRLSELYGASVQVERTPSGRYVVGAVSRKAKMRFV